jgi:hypothetical protein
VGKFVDKVVGFNSIADLLSNFEDFARATSLDYLPTEPSFQMT